MGRQAAETVVQRIEARAARSYPRVISLQPELVVRGTTKRLADGGSRAPSGRRARPSAGPTEQHSARLKAAPSVANEPARLRAGELEQRHLGPDVEADANQIAQASIDVETPAAADLELA